VKRFVYLVIVAALPLALVACGGTAAASGNTSAVATVAPNTPLARPSQLAVGVIKLEGTANAVNTTQAAALLPLWQAYSSLLSSSTSAPAEYQGLQNQIEAAMTPEQLKAIDAMKLTQGDLQTAFQSLVGGSFPVEGTPSSAGMSGNSNSVPGQSSPAGGGDSGGGGPPPGGDAGIAGGGFAADGGVLFPSSGSQGTPGAAQSTTLATQVAAADAVSKVAGVNAHTVSLVVRFLETKVDGTPTRAPTITATP
jgi:hypothetical protein